VGPFLRHGRLAAVDVAYCALTDRCHAALVLWDVAARRALGQWTASAPAVFPYVPGLLSFREIPPLLPLLRRLPEGAVDLLLCDGQGIAHPRRFGLAAHLGVLYDLPSLGWAKTRLVGCHVEPAPEAGSAEPLMDGAEQVGWAFRSREGCRATFVSPGHRLSLAAALALARGLAGPYRLCEPARAAHGLTRRAMAEAMRG